jgi:hypothetical protein
MVYNLESVRKEVMLIEEWFLEPNIIQIIKDWKKQEENTGQCMTFFFKCYKTLYVYF